MAFYIAAFHYDVTQAGGFSWDDQPELMVAYETEMRIADMAYQWAWILIFAGLLMAILTKIAPTLSWIGRTFQVDKVIKRWRDRRHASHAGDSR